MVTAKGAATQNRILEAAVDLLVRGGAQNLSLDEILAATRTSKGQLFHYFPGGRGELLREATRRQVERLVRDEPTTKLDSLDAWQGWIDGVVALHEEQSEADACEVAALAGRALDSDAEERTIVGGAFTQWFELIHGRLSWMRESGLLREDAPVDQLASLMVSAMQGGAVMDKATDSRDHLRHSLQGAYAYLSSFAIR